MNASTANASAVRLEQQGSFELAMSADAAFPLFSAEGERLWIPGWNPTPIFPVEDVVRWQKDAVWTIIREGVPQKGMPAFHDIPAAEMGALTAFLKTLGAPGGSVVAIYMTQTMMLALVGIALGLATGVALPFLVAATVGPLLPLPIDPVRPRARAGPIVGRSGVMN